MDPERSDRQFEELKTSSSQRDMRLHNRSLERDLLTDFKTVFYGAGHNRVPL
jgi:hypothetical protein